MSKQGVAVGVRVRPLLAEESGEEECIRIEGGRVAVTGSHRLRQFPFQYLFDRTASQQQVFQLFALPLLEDLFKGHNCCLVCYGQNTSGKSYTVCGGESEETKGVVPRIVDHLCCKLYAEEAAGRKIILRVSYVDIFQEQVFDLLSIRKGVVVTVGEGKDHQPLLRNVEMKSITKVEDIETHFILGNRKRQLAYNKKYRSSEHSTSVFTLYLETLEEGKVRRGQLDIVEMQASEVISRSEPINRQYDISAFSFRNVVNSLTYGNATSLVPFNDSKVTQILRNALGGNAKTKILFHLSPTARCHDASISTLRTASACQLIENTPECNIADHSLIQQVVEQQQQLSQQLQQVESEIKALEEVEKGEVEIEVRKGQDEDDNQFLSHSMLLRKQKQERQNAHQKYQQTRDSIKKQMHNLHSLFLVIEPLKNKHQIAFFKENYASALDRLSKNAQALPPSPSPYESAQNWSLTQTSFRKLNERERFYRQEVADLQRQFQQEREQLLTSLRQVTERFKFYEKVAQRAVRREEIDLLRSSSKYDPTKRTYEMPMFAIKDKRLSHASRFFSPLANSRAISERKFMMTQIGEKGKRPEVKQITSQHNLQESNNPYFQPIPKKIKRPRQSKQEGPHRMNQDQYELVRESVMSNRLKRKTPQTNLRSSGNNSSRSVKVKPILSPRFRFK